ncbi:MAG: preprotein translocase subunit SecG [Patescibacteria group bacterium]|nr:preprotein translocase subunit SecG [Patescibacteria group bacterium]MDD5490988.1 preprotein translocase subunit SecG [Patescibacteria group bacterium]
MKYLTILQIVIAVLLMIVILLQRRGTGLGSAFGGESNVYRTKRGIEKSLFISTIIFSILFLGTALLLLVLQK